VLNAQGRKNRVDKSVPRMVKSGTEG